MLIIDRAPWTTPGSLAVPDSKDTYLNKVFGRDGIPSDTESLREFPVRITAQRLLARHLTVEPGSGTEGDGLEDLPDTYWQGIWIDLSGALLMNFDFSWCRARGIDFRVIASLFQLLTASRQSPSPN